VASTYFVLHAPLPPSRRRDHTDTPLPGPPSASTFFSNPSIKILPSGSDRLPTPLTALSCDRRQPRDCLPTASDSDITTAAQEVHRYMSTMLQLYSRGCVLIRPNNFPRPLHVLHTYETSKHDRPPSQPVTFPAYQGRTVRKIFTEGRTPPMRPVGVTDPLRAPNNFRHVHKITRDLSAKQALYTRHRILAMAWGHHSRLPCDWLHDALGLAPYYRLNHCVCNANRCCDC
jgi:hypothetical protein